MAFTNQTMRRARKRLGLSQTALAKLIGVYRYTVIYHFEYRNKKLTFKSALNAKKIAKVLGIGIDDVLPGAKKLLEERVVKLVHRSNLEKVPYQPSDYEINAQLYETLNSVIDKLPEREAFVVRSYYGIGCERKTLEQLAAIIMKTRERVRQIRERALIRLRLKRYHQPLIDAANGAVSFIPSN